MEYPVEPGGEICIGRVVVYPGVFGTSLDSRQLGCPGH